MSQRPPRQPWSKAPDAVVEALGVDPAQGLDDEQVRRRRAEHGPNVLRETGRVSAWAILARQFRSLIVGLLVAAAVVSAAFGQWTEAAAIAAVIVLNAAIGFGTELRAVRSMEALRRLGRATARVRRGGREREVPAAELVRGDILLYEAGDVVTADARLIEASKLQANESTLTGESTPVTKAAEAVEADTALVERSSMLFKGTSVTRGSGAGVVVATGMDTELGRIASLAESAEQASTPLERRLEKLGRRLIWITLAIAAITSVAGTLRGKEVFLMIQTGIALAVAAVPEGLPIVATLALARGMWRMARRNVLINRLSAVETLGATNVIFCDKTGTLTENRMRASRLVLDGAPIELDDEIEIEGRPALRAALEIGVLCNNASLQEEDDDGVGDPMEVALLAAGRRAGLDRRALVEEAEEVREEAFDPERRMMATFHDAGGRYRVAVKGAAEAVLEACTRQGAGDDATELTGEDREAWLRREAELAADGLRVLALAEKTVDSVDVEPYEDLALVGLIGMRDPPRDDVRPALDEMRNAGVRLVMVTGDQPDTARSIGRALGLVERDDERVVVGREIPPAGDLAGEEAESLASAAIFARVEPRQKLDLIQLYQDRGAVVAMTGDGVNDAPALRKADIGVAMGRRGTQVAREASAMILRDDRFSSIVQAIAQGRVIFQNIRRFVLYLMSCNLSEILIVFGASAAGAPLPVLPLQILYLNLVTDVFPALALGFGEGGPDVMKRPPRDPGEPILTNRHWIAIVAWSLLITVSVLGALFWAVKVLGFDEQRAVTVSFLTLAMAQLWHAFDMRDRGSPLLDNDVARNPWLWGALGLCALLLLAAMYLPVLSGVLNVAEPGWAGWTTALVASLAPMLIGQVWLGLGSRGAGR